MHASRQRMRRSTAMLALAATTLAFAYPSIAGARGESLLDKTKIGRRLANFIRPKPVVVIMAGGIGERLWPYSQAERPKQLIHVPANKPSLLQQAYVRALGLTSAERIIVMTNGSMVDMIRKDLASVKHPSVATLKGGLDSILRRTVVGEPTRKDSAAAIAWATLAVERKFGERTPIAVFSADHAVPDTDACVKTFKGAIAGVRRHRNAIYTIGIEASYPETGYGYLEPVPESEGGSLGKHGVVLKRFVEKPGKAYAQKLIDAGGKWNAGLFVFTAGHMIREFEKHSPEHLKLSPSAQLWSKGQAHERTMAEDFDKVPSTSIDYAIMEPTERKHMMSGDWAWNDIGNWPALAQELGEQDRAGNHYSPHLRLVAENAKDSIVLAERPAPEHGTTKTLQVVVSGLEDVHVERKGSSLLIERRSVADLPQGVDVAINAQTHVFNAKRVRIMADPAVEPLELVALKGLTRTPTVEAMVETLKDITVAEVDKGGQRILFVAGPGHAAKDVYKRLDEALK